MPVKIVSGNLAFERAVDDIVRLGKRCLIVTSCSAAVRSGALEDVTAGLKRASIEFQIYDKIESNPRTAVCRDAGAAARAFGADFLIGIGGGSPLDAAKAAAVYAVDESIAADDIFTLDARALRPLPTVLVGTTAGTGSEVTGVSVLTTESGRKKSVSGAAYYGSIAVCDPKYTVSMPIGESVSTALDAFCHAAESFLSERADCLSELYAEKALPMVWSGLTQFYEQGQTPDMAGRESLLYGSIFAGLAINYTGTLFPHTLGYVLTEQKQIPHGRACAAFMPPLIDRYEKFALKKLMRLYGLLNTDREELLRIVGTLADVHVRFGKRELQALAKERYHAPINAFLRTPGGFDAKDAVEALYRLA